MEFILEAIFNLFGASNVDGIRPSTILFCVIGLILLIGILFVSL